ncbi:hypothetical protein SprV_0802469400 [Sparganum proliferum]
MNLHLTLRESNISIITRAYTQTITDSEKAKSKFYKDLHTLLASVPKADKLTVLGDFNIRVGTDHVAWRGAQSPHETTDGDASC